MNKKRILSIAVAAAVILIIIAAAAYGIYEKYTEKRAVELVRAVETSQTVSEEKKRSEEFLLEVRQAPTEIYFLDKPLDVETYFYDGRLYVPFEESYDKIMALTDEKAEEYGLIPDNFMFSGYSEEKINPYFLEIEGKCFISFYKLVKGMGLTCRFESADDKAFIYYRKTDTSDLPELVKSDNPTPALLRLEDITPDTYCENPRYTDEGLEKLRCLSDYLLSRGQTFYIAWIMRYVNPKQDIDVDFTKEVNTYSASFLYTLDYVLDRGGKIVLHGYTHQYGDYFSADGFEFGYFSTLDSNERARRLVTAKNAAETLGYDNSMFEFPHYGATAADLAMAETVYDVIFQSANKLFKDDEVVVKNGAGGHKVTYVPLPAYYLNNIYELEDMMDRIQDCEDKNCTLGLFFHPSIDFKYISVETTPWGVRNWHYTPYGALPLITDKVIGDGYSFGYFEDFLK